MNCDLALCMTRLGRRAGAEELFTMVSVTCALLLLHIGWMQARIQDQYTLRHMDTFARILDPAKLQRFHHCVINCFVTYLIL